MSILQISSINNILKFAELIYSDSSIYLERKRDKFLLAFDYKKNRNKSVNKK